MTYETLATEVKDGDLLYGLDQPRAEALAALADQGKYRTEMKFSLISFLCSCSPYVSTQKKIIRIQNDLTNSVWDPGLPNQYMDTSDASDISSKLTDPTRAVAFKAFLESHKRYNVIKDVYDGSTKSARMGWAKTSKAGLEFQTSYREATVHFIVTGIKLSDVAGKTGHGEKGNITSSELRWIYRHKDIGAVISRIRFWDENGEVFNYLSRPEWNNYTGIKNMGRMG